MDTRHATAHTRLGAVLLVARGAALAGVFFPHHWHPPAADAIGPAVALADDAVLREAATQLDAFLAGERTAFTLTTATAGDAFCERVWALLAEIPYGATTTYGALAQRLGDRALARRVGQAVGRNPIAIVVPCHRVVGHDGSLTGYAGGLERKQRLLELEDPTRTLAGTLF
jgi:methylated-DNA-[protein]-cysteine S-methyltransferase